MKQILEQILMVFEFLPTIFAVCMCMCLIFFYINAYLKKTPIAVGTQKEKGYGEGEYIKRMEYNKMFLLSEEEYRYYKEKISIINDWWWLRSPGCITYYASYVFRDGCVGNGGVCVDSNDLAVRPALRVPNLQSFNRIEEGCVIYNKQTWEVIDEALDLVIAHKPIGYDRFDDKLNNYETSHVKQKLEELSKEWLKTYQSDKIFCYYQ